MFAPKGTTMTFSAATPYCRIADSAPHCEENTSVDAFWYARRSIAIKLRRLAAETWSNPGYPSSTSCVLVQSDR